jgi:hypothetical protein
MLARDAQNPYPVDLSNIVGGGARLNSSVPIREIYGRAAGSAGQTPVLIAPACRPLTAPSPAEAIVVGRGYHLSRPRPVGGRALLQFARVRDAATLIRRRRGVSRRGELAGLPAWTPKPANLALDLHWTFVTA